jgi:serine/threonine protein kinase
MDYLSGKDLRYHLLKRYRFDEEETKFIIACLVHALEYMHMKNILHRDVKPENLVFDSNGYLHLTDMGIARVWTPQNQKDTSGTPGYMSPEVMMRTGHGLVSDMFAVGVIAFECMMGRVLI